MCVCVVHVVRWMWDEDWGVWGVGMHVALEDLSVHVHGQKDSVAYVA